MVTVRQVMTTPVITVAATASVDDVAEALKRHGSALCRSRTRWAPSWVW
jgi:CBS domain-containing protein